MIFDDEKKRAESSALDNGSPKRPTTELTGTRSHFWEYWFEQQFP